jgi:hypothetical protein
MEVHDNLGTIVGAGIDTFWMPELPAPIQVGLAVRLTGTADELRQDVDHDTRNILTGPDGQVVSDVGGTFQIDQPDARAEWLNGFVLPTAVQFVAESEGTYQFEHIVDGNSKSVAIHVIAGQPGQPPAEGADQS